MSRGPVLLSETDPPKVLLVDDEATGRRLLRRWVERGFDGKVVEAENGLEALEALAAEEFDLVVLDLMMPVLDGTETLSLIRSDPNHGDVDVVVSTQLASEQKVRDIISLGVADYILKPLRYESVVDRLYQVISRARERKKERRRKSDLPVVLIADPDPNFCDFAISALSGRCHGIAARTAAETLVGVLKNEPHLVMLARNLPGLPADMLGKKVLALTKARQGAVCRISEGKSNEIEEDFAGQVVRTFVPESFAAEVLRLVAGSGASGGSEPWLTALEPEISSAVRQAMGMMTGIEPNPVDQLTGGDPDVFVLIDLRAESGEFDLIVELRCQRAFGVALCNAMLGAETSDVDNELLMSGAGEILNVVGGRIKNSCANRKIDVLLGLPELIDAPRDVAKAFYSWEQHFIWQDYCFRLGVFGMAGTMGGGGRAPASDAGIAASTAKRRGDEVAAEGESAKAEAAKGSEAATPDAAEGEPKPDAGSSAGEQAQPDSQDADSGPEASTEAAPAEVVEDKEPAEKSS